MAQRALRAVPSSSEISQVRVRVQALDLKHVMARVMKEQGWSESKSYEAEAQYRAFLVVAFSNPGIRLVPSFEIDEVWHSHILHTRDYASDCDSVFGGYLHHNPRALDDLDMALHRDQFENMKRLLAEELHNDTYASVSIRFESMAICDGGAYCDGDITQDVRRGSDCSV